MQSASDNDPNRWIKAAIFFDSLLDLENGRAGSKRLTPTTSGSTPLLVLPTHESHAGKPDDKPTSSKRWRPGQDQTPEDRILEAARTRRLPNPFNKTDVRKKNWSGLKSAEEVERVLEALVASERLIPGIDPPNKKGKKTTSYSLAPETDGGDGVDEQDGPDEPDGSDEGSEGGIA